ncbi:unnamed protein product [Blepharisma stoltei]|uniref:Uncharacterized protein n=1 Tax=Blepharisma stoltei TaxID=1481888 RepID=A0AAU9K740_9CILI|nr:unnamed protein product [Blepharisma stoltei]
MKKSKSKSKKKVKPKHPEDTPNTAIEKRAIRTLLNLSDDMQHYKASSLSGSEIMSWDHDPEPLLELTATKKNETIVPKPKAPVVKPDNSSRTSRLPPPHPLSAKSSKNIRIENKPQLRPHSVTSKPILPIAEHLETESPHSKSASQNVQLKHLLNLNTVSLDPPTSKTPINRFVVKQITPKNSNRNHSLESKSYDKENSDIEELKLQLKKLTRRPRQSLVIKKTGKIPMVKLVDSLFSKKSVKA